MAIVAEPLAAAWWAGRAIVTRRERDPLAWIRWLPLQARYLESQSKARLLRAGNQALGKTTVALADLLWHALGEHPHRAEECAEAGEYWIACASWAQSVAIQGKLWELIPQDRLHPDTVWTQARGFRGKNPAVEVRHRSGAYSLIRFKTGSQDPLQLAGATVRGALFDEPPRTREAFSEVQKRVLAQNGWYAIAMTPINAPVGWIREDAEAGRFEDVHAPLSPEQLIPVGGTRPRRLRDGTICDAEWIAQLEASTAPHEIPVRIHGDWEVRTIERYFSVFRSSGSGAHCHEHPPDGEIKLALGVDHGSRPGKQIAVLTAVDEGGGGRAPAVYVLDEYCDRSGVATPDEDAAGILAMLRRHGFQWRDLAFAHGDIVHMQGTGKQKSNRDLAGQLAKQLRIPLDALNPQLRTVKRGRQRGAGSVQIGSRWLYHAMLRPGGFGISGRCQRLIESLDRYTMADDDWKDPVDALRYALDPWIFSFAKFTANAPIRLY